MKQLLSVSRDVPQHWVGDGFPVRSLFGVHNFTPAISPFLMLDYAGPHEFPPSRQQPGVGEHPHRGFETVTIMYQGEVAHRDSAGNQGVIGPGDVQWMTAASGVVHEEFHTPEFAQRGGVFELVQLWVNLSAAFKMSPPRYQEIRDSQIPTVELAGGAGTVRVIAGEYGGAKGPAKTFTPIQVWDLSLNAGHAIQLPLPEGYFASLVIQRGRVTLNGSERVEPVSLAMFDRGSDRIDVHTDEDARVLLLAGEPIDEPIVAQGPFVMNTREEIRQAIADYQNGRMGSLR